MTKKEKKELMSKLCKQLELACHLIIDETNSNNPMAIIHKAVSYVDLSFEDFLKEFLDKKSK